MDSLDDDVAFAMQCNPLCNVVPEQLLRHEAHGEGNLDQTRTEREEHEANEILTHRAACDVLNVHHLPPVHTSNEFTEVLFL